MKANGFDFEVAERLPHMNGVIVVGGVDHRTGVIVPLFAMTSPNRQDMNARAVEVQHQHRTHGGKGWPNGRSVEGQRYQTILFAGIPVADQGVAENLRKALTPVCATR